MKRIFKLFFKLVGLITHIGEKIKNNIQRSIRMQLFTTFILCALGSFFVSRAVLPLFENINESAIVDYSFSMRVMYFQAHDIAELAIQENSVDSIRQSISQENEKMENHQNTLKMIVTDEDGEVLYKTKQVKEEHIDLHEEIRNAMSFTMNQLFEKGFPSMVTSR
ncbi:MAG: two-component sensor histidine kinase, partial [Lysinibacillus fusiformis]|nr:two-component sensor histidine kinase [Lysinibacillus fusiformis]